MIIRLWWLSQWLVTHGHHLGVTIYLHVAPPPGRHIDLLSAMAFCSVSLLAESHETINHYRWTDTLFRQRTITGSRAGEATGRLFLALVVQYTIEKQIAYMLLYGKMFTSEIDMQHVKKDFYKVHYILRVSPLFT